jgi:hypothetical protein
VLQKLEVRERKRQALPVGSEWHSAKYNAAFSMQQMSDDEDTYGDDKKLIPNIYTANAPASWSEIVRFLNLLA